MGESIEPSSKAAERRPGSPYHSTPKQAAPETGGQACGKEREFKELEETGGGQREKAGARSKYTS